MIEMAKVVVAVLVAQIALVGVIALKDVIANPVDRAELSTAFSQRDSLIKDLSKRVKQLESAGVGVKK